MNKIFVYEAFLNAYYLAFQIGDLPKAKKAFLKDHVLAFKKNKQLGFPKAFLESSPGDKVYGAVYEFEDKQLDLLQDKVVKGFNMSLEPVSLSGNLNCLALVPVPTTNGETVPYDWYIDLMIAGLRQIGAPGSYIAKLEDLPKDNSYHISGSHAKSVLANYPFLISKNLEASFELIENLNTGGKFTIKSKKHPLNGREMQVFRDGKGFGFETTIPIKKGWQDPRDLIMNNPDITLSSAYRISKKSYVIDSAPFGDTVRILRGSIQSLEETRLKKRNYHWRLIVPVNEGIELRRDFSYWNFLSNGKSGNCLLKIGYKNEEFHFYGLKREKQHYVLFDSLSEISLERFQKITYAIMLVYAILKGKLCSGEGFFIAFKDSVLRKPEGVRYSQMSDGKYGLPAMFTTNPYFGIEQVKYKRNNKGTIPTKLIKEREKGLGRFKEENFDGLVSVLLESDKIRDSYTQIIHNQNTTLEIKIPVLFVALETISGVFSKGGDKDLKPIQNKKVAGKLVDQIKKITDAYVEENRFDEDQLEQMIPFYKRIAGLNNPTNTDKLTKTFPMLGYDLESWDSDAIKERNAFLHGFTPSFKIPEDETGFRDYYDLSLRLHFLLTVLLLKKAGYVGKVINYNKLHEHITEKNRNEEVLVMI
jgi:hypothetical protein